MGCCILAALIIAQCLALRHRVASWLGIRMDREEARQSPSAWRLGAAEPLRSRRPPGPRVAVDAAGIAIVATFALVGYLGVAHGEHLSASLRAATPSSMTVLPDARCTGRPTR